MTYIMGVDGGGTKTFTVITDKHGNKLGSGVSGGGNHQSIGMPLALKHIKESIDQALREANLQAEDIDFVQYGLAGADRPKDFSIIEPALATLPFSKWQVVCDTYEGLRTGCPDNVGVVVVCGTGTNAAGRNSIGKMVQTGGFGYLFGDHSGGEALAAETFRAAVRAWEMREEQTILTKMVPDFLGFSSMEDVYNHYLDEDIYHVTPELTRVLHTAADRGDKVAINILETTGKELGLAAKSVVRRLGDMGIATIPIVLIGSVIQKGRNKHLLDALTKTFASDYPNHQLIIPEMAPVYGAVLLGMDQLNIHTPAELYQKFVSYGGYLD